MNPSTLMSKPQPKLDNLIIRKKIPIKLKDPPIKLGDSFLNTCLPTSAPNQLEDIQITPAIGGNIPTIPAMGGGTLGSPNNVVIRKKIQIKLKEHKNEVKKEKVETEIKKPQIFLKKSSSIDRLNQYLN